MPALGGATACQTALVLTFKILLCCANKILLSQGDFSGMLPTNSPKISEANATMCFQKWILGKAAVQCTELQLTLESDEHESCKIFPQVHKHRDDTNRRPDPSLLVPQILAYNTNMVTLRNLTPNTGKEL